MRLEIEWRDELPVHEQSITVTHHINGKNAALLKYMLEIQLAHDEQDIIYESSGEDSMGIECITYHMKPEQARKLIDAMDGIRYGEEWEFVSYGTFWKKEQEERYLRGEFGRAELWRGLFGKR